MKESVQNSEVGIAGPAADPSDEPKVGQSKNPVDSVEEPPGFFSSRRSDDLRDSPPPGSEEPLEHNQPGAEEGAGQNENKEPERAGNNMPKDTPASTGAGEEPRGKRKPRRRMAERATALRGLAATHPRRKRSAIRRGTEQDLRGPDPEVPWIRAELALHDLVCSLMERQDRMNEAIFLKINDLGYRMDDAEADLGDLKKRRWS